jgi:antitoxin MazE
MDAVRPVHPDESLMEGAVRSAKQPRQGWDEAFRSMAEHGDDRLANGESDQQTSWDETEWEW